MAQDVARPVAKGAPPDAVANARQRVEEVREALGDRHPDFASGLIQWALLLIMRGEPDEAEPLLREALDIRRETLGERHPDYATCLSSLAGLLWARGDLNAAEPLLRQALEIRCEVWGEKHPKTVVSMNSLEQLLQALNARAATTEEAAASTPARSDPAHATVQEAPPSLGFVPEAATPDQTMLPGRSSEPTETAPPLEARGDRAELEQALLALTGVFSSLSGRLTEAAEELKAGGVVPSDPLIAELGRGRHQFLDLRAQALDLAGSLELRDWEERGVGSIEDLADLLRAIESAEIERSKQGMLRKQALGALDRVLGLAHADQPEFPALAACHGQARDLIRSVAETPLSALGGDVAQLAAGEHPLSALLVLAGGDEGLSDEEWARSHELVETHYGKSLAVAAARGKLVSGSPSDVSTT